eukprot:GFUD01020026.1.p1 GENE.GFUD01020026.1~~GFUD01020026.1.p1  ORF type:complete len:416 (-),score=82.55 GFUD01020026.1:407-1654(-)
MELSECFSNCSAINLTTCSFLHQQQLKPVVYDENGCYIRKDYFGEGDKYQHYLQFSRIVSVVMMVVGVAGLLGNTIAVLVLARPEVWNCFNKIVIAMNIMDSGHIIFALLDCTRNSFPGWYPDILLQIFPVFHYPLYRITMVASIFLIMGTAIERYLAVCRPHHYHKIQDRPHRALAYILPSIGAAILVNLPRFFDTEVKTRCMDFIECGCGKKIWSIVQPTAFRKSRDYVIYYHTWTWTIVTGILPVVCLIFLNSRIYMCIKRLQASLAKRQHSTKEGVPMKKTFEKRIAQQKRDCNLAVVLSFTVLMFLLTHLPRIMTSIYEGVTIRSVLKCHDTKQGYLKIWYLYILSTIQLLQVVNASLNFPIYWILGATYKATFSKNLLMCEPSFHKNQERTKQPSALLEPAKPSFTADI